jgi:hypothetical protein
MKRVLFVICISTLLILSAGLNSSLTAQPQYYNYNTNGSNNSFPFNIDAGKQVQLLYLPGDFNQPAPAPPGNITSISFRIGDTYPLGPWTYTDFTMTITLDTPFPYDPTQSLIVDVGQCAVPGATGFSACFTNLTENRRNWSVSGCPFVYGGQNASVYHLGLTLTPASAVFPAPTLTEWGMIILAVFLGIGSVYYLRRRRLTV